MIYGVKYCMYIPLERVTLIISSYFAFNVMTSSKFFFFLLSNMHSQHNQGFPWKYQFSKQLVNTIRVCLIYYIELLL